MTDSKGKNVQNEWNFGNAQIVGGNQNWGATINGGTFTANTNTKGENKDEEEQEEIVRKVLKEFAKDWTDSEETITCYEYSINKIKRLKEDWKRELMVEVGEEEDDEKIELSGDKEIIVKINKDEHCIVLPSESKENNGFFPVIVVEKKKNKDVNNNVCQKVGVAVIMKKDRERLKGKEKNKKELIIKVEKNKSKQLEKSPKEQKSNNSAEQKICQGCVNAFQYEGSMPFKYCQSSGTNEEDCYCRKKKSDQNLETDVNKAKTTREKSEKRQTFTTRDDVSISRVKPNLKRLINKGGYGEVYYGEWKSQEVAVKKLPLHNTSESDLEEIQKEIDILKNLRNRYIIQYYGIYSENRELFIIMDYAENGTLTKFINDNRDKEHNWDLNNQFIKQIARGLAYIHHENIIHRDLKSMNILLTNNYQVKISDFGLSRTRIISSYQSKRSSAIGTLRWMAPEALKEQKYSKQSDIYSLGMIIWEISAKCTKPFKDIDNSLAYIRIVSGGEEIIPNDIPKNIQEVIQRCWKSNPSERISLEKIIEVIENADELDSPTIHVGNSIESLKLFEVQGSQKISSQLNKFSHSLIVNFEDIGKILNKEKAVIHYSSQEVNFNEKFQDVEIHLRELIDSAKGKLKSKSKFPASVKKRDEGLDKVFQDLPTIKEEFIEKLENIKKGLSKKLTEEEINNLCQKHKELVELRTKLKNLQEQQKSQIQIPPK
jgi:serine/threonine protein kinase